MVHRLHPVAQMAGLLSIKVIIRTTKLPSVLRHFASLSISARSGSLRLERPRELFVEGVGQAAQVLGRERFQVFVTQVGRRLAGDHRLISDVLKTIAVDHPDLFATATDDAAPRSTLVRKPRQGP